VKYKGDVKIVASPQKGLQLVYFVAAQSLKLFVSDKQRFKKLYASLKKRNNNIRHFLRDMGAILPILNNRPDIFHIQWAKTLVVYPELMELLDCKKVISLRGAHINYSPLNDNSLAEAYRKFFPKTEAFHAVSKAIGAEAQKYGAAPDRIEVIYTSVRDSLLDENVRSAERGKRLELISIGRFHWKKGDQYALDSMKLLKKRGLNFHYTIIAQGEVPEEITFLLNEYELKDQITIIPGLDYSRLIEMLRASHVLLLPSVEEGIANVVLEAMAVGVPVVSTDCGGMKEAVNDGVNGFVVSVRDAEAMADKITELSEMNDEEIKKMINEARETVAKLFSRSRQIEHFVSFYNKIAAG
jgi:colanic acid/amylovoran biosynthesis glycosyltransferase